MKNKAIDIANDRRESNILIAEFMGYTYAEQEDLVFKPGEVTKKDGKIRKANGDFTHCNLLRYHESWDKLMAVVEKIDRTEMSNGDYFQTSIGKHKTSIFRKDKLSVPYLNEEIYSGSDDRLENTYKAVVELIKYYNQ